MVAILCSIMAGAFAVLQAGMNRMVSQAWGHSSALLLNGLVFLLFNALVFWVVKMQPQLFPNDYLIQGKMADFKLWWILPGICGFLLVTGLLISISQIGAVQTFVICIASQIICGVAWDLLMENREITLMRFVGACVTLVGAVIASRS